MKESENWDDIPASIKETFNKLGVGEEESKFFSGVKNQFDSQTIYKELEEELQAKRVIFTDIDTAIKQYPELVKKYFAKLVPPDDNKFAALNSATFSGGTFIYIPKGVKLEKQLQAYFRINTKSIGQFERTLIIVDEDASLQYVEGCTAPIYDKNNLHAAVVEIFLEKNAMCKYITIQN
jgi:Fe-S cluster assembly protein SufB